MKIQKGMTQMEILVVITVIFILLLILYFGAKNWKKDEAERECFKQQEEYEVALLKYVACKDLKEGTEIEHENVLIHDGIKPSNFKCPENGVYTFDKFLQFTKKPAVICSKHKIKRVE